MQQHVTGPWPPDDWERLREVTVTYAADALSALRTSIASGAVMSVALPTADRLASMVELYGPGEFLSTQVVELGEHPDQVLVEQFGTPMMHYGTPLLLGSSSEDELVRATFGVVGAGATFVAALDERPAPTDE